MEFLTDEKLVIVGAAGMIGSNMAQTAAMMRLTSNICLFDTYAPGLEGVVEELRHCGFSGINFTYTSDVAEACLLYTSPSPRDKRQSRMPS